MQLRPWLAHIVTITAGSGVMATLLLTGRASEGNAAAVVAGTLVATAGCHVVIRVLRGRGTVTSRVTVLCALGFAAAAAGLPAIEMMVPGRPAAAGELSVVGDTLSIPGDVRGQVRLFIKANANTSARVVRVELSATGEKVAVRIDRRARQHGIGVGFVGHARRTPPSAYAISTIPKTAQQLTLTALQPSDASPVTVAVYRLRWTHRLLLYLYAFAFVFAVATESVLAQPAGVAFFASSVLLYGMYLRGLATPAYAFTPVLVGILPSVVLGGFLSLAGLSVGRRIRAVLVTAARAKSTSNQRSAGRRRRTKGRTRD